MSAPALPASPLRARIPLVGLALALLACAAVAALAIPHHASTVQPPRALNPNGLIAGQTLQQARCSNWQRASAAERAFAVQSLAGVAGAPTEYKGAVGTTLTTDEAYNLLNGACSHRIARNFLLYELYNRAAGFRSLAVAQP